MDLIAQCLQLHSCWPLMTGPQRALMLLAYHPVATDACGSHAAGGARCRDGGRLAGQEKEEDEGEERVLNKSYIKLGQQT
jgi:hypothetical protein